MIAADADPDFKADAVAAQVAGVIDIGARLAAELASRRPGTSPSTSTDLNVVLAPFGSELMLVLAGAPSALICEYRLIKTRRLTARAGARRPDRPRRHSWKTRSNSWTTWRGASASAPAATSSWRAGSAPYPEAATRTAR